MTVSKVGTAWGDSRLGGSGKRWDDWRGAWRGRSGGRFAAEGGGKEVGSIGERKVKSMSITWDRASRYSSSNPKIRSVSLLFVCCAQLYGCGAMSARSQAVDDGCTPAIEFVGRSSAEWSQLVVSPRISLIGCEKEKCQLPDRSDCRDVTLTFPQV